MAPFLNKKDVENFLPHLKRQTPNNSGIWKNIIGTANLQEADYYVIMEDLIKGISIDFKRTICFQCEPPYIQRIIKSGKVPHLQRLFSQDIKYLKHYTFKNHHYPCIWTNSDNFNDLNLEAYPEKDIQLSSIMRNNSTHLGHKLRLDYLNKFAQKYPNDIEIYGWDMPVRGPYKGELRNGHTINNSSYMSSDYAFKKYRYSLICEGSIQGIMAPRICDCILNWTFPIYWGSKRIFEYFSEDVVSYIDIEKDNIDKLYELSQKPITPGRIKALAKARQLILYRYNIWEEVYQTLKEKEII